MNGPIYIASPYSHQDPEERQVRFEAVCLYCVLLINDGCHVYSPIAHTHPIALLGDLPKGWDYWQSFDRIMIEACSCVYALQIPGWEKSVGMTEEIKIAKSLGKMVTMIPEGEHFYNLAVERRRQRDESSGCL